MAAASVPSPDRTPALRRLGIAWMAIWAALALHVADEAANGFLFIYNPTVTALRERFGFWPMPNFTLEEFLTDLGIGVFVLALLTPFAFRNSGWMRPVIYFSAIVLCIANACGHTLGTILGHSVSTVHFSRPAPGCISSPILLFVGIYALVQLRRTRKGA